MAQFDVHIFEGGYALDCQADILSNLQTRFIVPLQSAEKAPPTKSRLNPIFNLEHGQVVMVTEFASTVFRRKLGRSVASLASQRDHIVAALDVLITGV